MAPTESMQRAGGNPNRKWLGLINQIQRFKKKLASVIVLIYFGMSQFKL
jgi:hypothetical protein